MARFTAGPNNDGSQYISASWATHHQIEKELSDRIFLGRDSSEEKASGVVLSRYSWNEDVLSEPKAEFLMEDGAPLKMAVHPGGDGVVFSFMKSCSMYEWDELNEREFKYTKGSCEVDLKLVPGVRLLGGLENIGRQNCLTFSTDGSFLASGGEDGRIRVFEWPTMDVILDLPQAHKSVEDMDFSLDSAFLATTSNNSPCRIWDAANCSGLVQTLPCGKGEKFGFCRFSRDGMKPFLFVTVTKAKNGLIGVWDIASWRRLGTKKFQDEPITAFAISHNGKRLAIGSQTGDISVIEVKKMEVHQRVRFAHLESISSLEFSPNDKAILSLSLDCSVRVSPVDLSREWKEWQVCLVLAGMILVSMFLFYMLYEFGDSFWQFPQGKDQQLTSTESIAYDDLVDYKTDL